jgi:hypothetical protein
MKASIAAILIVLMCAPCCGGGDASNDVSTIESVVGATVLDAFLAAYVAGGFTVRCSVKANGSEVVLDGPFHVRDTNHVTVAEGAYKQGVLHGELLGFHANGLLESRRLFRHGKYHGTGVDWDEDGRMTRSISFVAGEKEGIEKYWNNDGNVSSKVLWKSGVPQSIEFYQEGVVKSKLAGDAARDYFRQKALDAARKTSGPTDHASSSE